MEKPIDLEHRATTGLPCRDVVQIQSIFIYLHIILPQKGWNDRRGE